MKSTCPDCGAAMGQLWYFNSLFCPNDCDKKEPKSKSNIKEILVYGFIFPTDYRNSMKAKQELFLVPKNFSFPGGWAVGRIPRFAINLVGNYWGHLDESMAGKKYLVRGLSYEELAALHNGEQAAMALDHSYTYYAAFALETQVSMNGRIRLPVNSVITKRELGIKLSNFMKLDRSRKFKIIGLEPAKTGNPLDFIIKEEVATIVGQG
jgi:hypothetical protein